jgi:hypothetical protein
MMLKTMNDSYSVIKQFVPFEVTSRYLAAYFNVAGLDCTKVVGLAVTDPTKLTSICGIFTFSSLDNVQSFLQPLYYNNINMT